MSLIFTAEHTEKQHFVDSFITIRHSLRKDIKGICLFTNMYAILLAFALRIESRKKTSQLNES